MSVQGLNQQLSELKVLRQSMSEQALIVSENCKALKIDDYGREIIDEFDKEITRFVKVNAHRQYYDVMKSMFDREFEYHYYEEHYKNSYKDIELDPFEFNFEEFRGHIAKEWAGLNSKRDQYVAARDIRKFFNIYEDDEVIEKKGMMSVDIENNWSSWGGSYFHENTKEAFDKAANSLAVIGREYDCKHCKAFAEAIREVAEHYNKRHIDSRSGFNCQSGSLTMFKSGKLSFLLHKEIFNHIGMFLNYYQGFKRFF